MEQQLITKKGNLLNKDGSLIQTGYSKSFLLNYNREVIRKKSKLKEWDYIYFGDERYGVCLSISNLSYAAALSASIVDFTRHEYSIKNSIKLFPDVKPDLSENPKESFSYYKTKNAEFKFEYKDGKKHLTGYFNNFFKLHEGNKNLEFDIVLDNEPEESMVKVTSFKKKHQFCYNNKISCMTAEGTATINGRKYVFNKQNSFATLDWFRAILPYKNEWYWASMQSTLDREMIGFSLARGFGDFEEHTENMIFYKGKAHKINAVKIYNQRDGMKTNYLRPWTFYSDDGRLELMFEPFVLRKNCINWGLFKHKTHKVFGEFTGKLILDDGSEIEIKDKLGFSKKFNNRW